MSFCCGPLVTHIHLPTSELEDTFEPLDKTNHNVAKLQLYNKLIYDHNIKLKKYGIKNYRASRLVNLLLALSIITAVFISLLVFFSGTELGIYCLYHNYFIIESNNYALFGTCSLLASLFGLTFATIVLKNYTQTFLTSIHYIRYSKELYLAAPEYEKELRTSSSCDTYNEAQNTYSGYLSV